MIFWDVVQSGVVSGSHDLATVYAGAIGATVTGLVMVIKDVVKSKKTSIPLLSKDSEDRLKKIEQTATEARQYALDSRDKIESLKEIPHLIENICRDQDRLIMVVEKSTDASNGIRLALAELTGTLREMIRK